MVLPVIASRLGYLNDENLNTIGDIQHSNNTLILKLCGDGTKVGNNYLLFI